MDSSRSYGQKGANEKIIGQSSCISLGSKTCQINHELLTKTNNASTYHLSPIIRVTLTVIYH